MMTSEQLITRGQQNIADAAFVRDEFIPTALANARWNIAVFETFRVAELTVKGMMCLSRHAPRETHDLHHLIDQFQEILAHKPDSIPLIFGVRLKGGDSYGLAIWRHELELFKRVSGVYTQVETTDGDFPIHDLLRIRVQRVSGITTFRLGERLLLSTGDQALAGRGRVVRQFVSKPDPNRITRLKSSLKTLRDSRENAFFGTMQYSEHQARERESVRLLDTVLENAKAFVVNYTETRGLTSGRTRRRPP